jgi:hypothetical protein
MSKLAQLILCSLLLFASCEATFAQASWLDYSSRAGIALQAGNLDLAMKCLQQALPEAGKLDSVSPTNKADIERLLQNTDAWWHASEAKDAKEMVNLTSEKGLGQEQHTKKTKADLIENQKQLEISLRFMRDKIPLLRAAAALRKKLYGPQDTIAKDYEMAFAQPSAERIFIGCFALPIGQVSELSGGGYAWMGSDVWIRFRSSQPPLLFRKDYKVSDERPNLKELIEKFRKLCPKDTQGLSDASALEVVQGTIDGVPKHKAGWTLLSNKKQGVYWFRSWSSE